MSKPKQESRNRILEESIRLFAEKGFDATSIEEVTRAAGVNKALFYYYFKSKSAILEEMNKDFLVASYRMLLDFFGQYKEDVASYFDQGIEEFMEHYFDFLEEQSNTIRVLMMESMKKNHPNPPLFQLIDHSVKSEVDRLVAYLESKGVKGLDDKNQMLVTEFFTSFMPLAGYAVFGEQWCSQMKVDKSMLRKMFSKAFSDTHIAYHKRMVEFDQDD